MAKVSVAGVAVDGHTVLIAHRIAGGQMGGRWEFPGGKVEPGESDAVALAREFQEEFGITVTVRERIAEAAFTHNGEQVLLHAYLIAVPHKGDAERYALTEHTEYRWEAVEKITALPFVDSDLLLYPAVREHVLGQGRAGS